MGVGHTTCKVHYLAVGSKGARTVLELAVHITLNLLALLPFTLLIKFCHEDIGMLLPCNATEFIACSLLACGSGNYHRGILAYICGAIVAALPVEFLGLLYDVAVRILLPFSRLHCRLQAYLRHAVILRLLKESPVVLFRSLVIAFLQQSIGKI